MLRLVLLCSLSVFLLAEEESWLGQPIDLAACGYRQLRPGDDGTWQIRASDRVPVVIRLIGAERCRWQDEDWQSARNPLVVAERGVLACEGDGSVQVWMADLPSGEFIAGGIWARKLLNPAKPEVTALGTFNLREQVRWVAVPRLLTTVQWQGDNQAGSRSWGGNNLLLPPGVWWPIALGDYRIEEWSERGSRGLHTRQDAHVRLLLFDKPARQSPMAHGATFQLDKAFPANAIVVSLSFRHPGWNSRVVEEWGYTVGDHRLGSAVWQVPQGSTFYDAQKNPDNRLGGLDVLAHLSPEHRGPVFQLQAQPGGHWQLILDVGRDGLPDLVFGDHLDGCRPCDFPDIDGRSGTLITANTAGGFKPGHVGRTMIRLAIGNASDTVDVRRITGPSHPRAVAALAKREQKAAQQEAKAERQRERLSEANVSRLEQMVKKLGQQVAALQKDARQAKDTAKQVQKLERQLAAERKLTTSLEQDLAAAKKEIRQLRNTAPPATTDGADGF